MASRYFRPGDHGACFQLATRKIKTPVPMKNFSKVRQGDEQGWNEVGFRALQWRIGFPWLEKFRGRKIRWWISNRRFEERVFLERRSRFSKRGKMNNCGGNINTWL